MDTLPTISNDHDNDPLELPPGFRFHPTDEELITEYLWNKVLDPGFCAIAIGEADFNKVEPWDLPWKAKMGEKEWYFFCKRDKKYPTGLRTNRATSSGYWKATGKDKEIQQGKSLVGMKKTLVFYKGRAPKGEKTNWVMHEYRLEGKFSLQKPSQVAKNDWVISRVFEKTTGGKKTHISELKRLRSMGSLLPPLTDSSTITQPDDSLYVSCFSNPMSNSMLDVSLNPPETWASYPFNYGNSQCPNSISFEEEELMKSLLRNYGTNEEQTMKTEAASVSRDTGFSNEDEEAEAASDSVGMIELDYLLNY